MSVATLGQWLERIEQLHPETIELGLERVSTVLHTLLGQAPNARVITVAGTNGKGSTVECLSQCLLAQGRSVATYTSPHLIDFNERIVINGEKVTDETLIKAFETVDEARNEIALTYFEFTTLAALWLFAQTDVQFWVLEVGLGGRLDAVNCVDAEVTVITSISLDHQDWLGDTRELIAKEKSGIMRSGKTTICADPNPPAAIAEHAQSIGAKLCQLNRDFSYELLLEDQFNGAYCESSDAVAELKPTGVVGIAPTKAQIINWRFGEEQRLALRCPQSVALDNVAGALAALTVIDQLPSTEVLQEVFSRWRLAGRQQVFFWGSQWWLDVAHNTDSARLLANALSRDPVDGRCLVVIGMLADKPVDDVIRSLSGCVSEWIVVGIDAARAMAATELTQRITKLSKVPITCLGSVAAGCAVARARAGAKDRIIVTGSFHTVGPALAWLGL